MPSRIDQSQRKAARVVGLAYLVAMAVSVFAEFYVRGHLVVANSAVDTARNIMAHERLFRVGIASSLLVFAIDLALIAALYVVLKPVSQNLSLFAVFLRLVETTVGAAATLSDFDVLRILSGADYLRVIETDRLQALARLSLGAHGAGNTVVFVFLGLGSTVFPIFGSRLTTFLARWRPWEYSDRCCWRLVPSPSSSTQTSRQYSPRGIWRRSECSK